jgi:hypothetical protein
VLVVVLVSVLLFSERDRPKCPNESTSDFDLSWETNRQVLTASRAIHVTDSALPKGVSPNSIDVLFNCKGFKGRGLGQHIEKQITPLASIHKLDFTLWLSAASAANTTTRLNPEPCVTMARDSLATRLSGQTLGSGLEI